MKVRGASNKNKYFITIVNEVSKWNGGSVMWITRNFGILIGLRSKGYKKSPAELLTTTVV